MMNTTKFFVSVLLITCTNVYARPQYCLDSNIFTPPISEQRYELLNNGNEVKDKVTGLIWQRCSVGMEWNGNTCDYKAKRQTYPEQYPFQMTWMEASKLVKEYGPEWRLPNIKELFSLVDFACINAINQKIFPETLVGRMLYELPGQTFNQFDNGAYWTSTPTSQTRVEGVYVIRFTQELNYDRKDYTVFGIRRIGRDLGYARAVRSEKK